MKTLIIGKRQAISNWVRQFATIIDIEKRVYKLQEGFLGIFKWGDFKPLPPINYVLVFKSFFAKCEACSLDEQDDESTFFQVSLVHHNNRRIVVHETKNKAEAFNLATVMSSALHTRLKDSASNRKQSVWLV